MFSPIKRLFRRILGGKHPQKSQAELDREAAIAAFKAQVVSRLNGGEAAPKPIRAPHRAPRPHEPKTPHQPRPPRERPAHPPRHQERHPEHARPSRQEEPARFSDEYHPDLLELFKPKKLDIPEETEPRTPFTQMPIDPEIQTVLKDLGFVEATPVQKACIEPALEKRNLMVSAMTGSGKTLGFVIPMIQRLRRGEIHQALILSPTREIAIQTHKAMEPFFANMGLSAGLVIGGTDMSLQKQTLRQYPPILVATPGRLCDMLGQGLVWLNYTDYVVLDEADRMLDMGFEEELMRIHKELPGTQQTLLFTATLMPEVIRIAEKYASDYLKLVVGKELSPADTISHFVVPIAPGRKFEALLSILKMHTGRTIVFFNTIKDVIHYATELRKHGHMDCTAIHSGKTQEQRNRAITDLREGQLRTLLGTDVAARGIDIPQVELVVNFDMPNNSEEYIHRIGRTGRAGYTGTAISFLGPRDAVLLEGVESLLKHAIPRETRFPFAMKGGEAPREERPRHGHAEAGRGGRPHRRGPRRPHAPRGSQPDAP